MTRELLRAMTAEAIGTFALVFAGCGAIMVDAKTHQLGHVGVAISFGLVIMFGIYAVGHISGAHFNAAVTFAFALTRHFPWTRALAHWAAQFVGAVCAALLRGSLGNIAHVGATLPSGSQGQAFVWELVMSSLWAESMLGRDYSLLLRLRNLAEGHRTRDLRRDGPLSQRYMGDDRSAIPLIASVFGPDRLSAVARGRATKLDYNTSIEVLKPKPTSFTEVVDQFCSAAI